MTQAEIKEIEQNWVLLTYDIPRKDQKVRDSFIKEAKAIGAVMHTESCYLLPYSDKAFELANKVAAIGNAVVWKSRQEDKEKAEEITTKYGDHLKIRCQSIEQRLVASAQYMQAGKLGVALIMGIKTGKLLQQLAQIAESFDPGWLGQKVKELTVQWRTIYEKHNG